MNQNITTPNSLLGYDPESFGGITRAAYRHIGTLTAENVNAELKKMETKDEITNEITIIFDKLSKKNPQRLLRFARGLQKNDNRQPEKRAGV